MKSIKRKFTKLNKQHPHWSSLICFTETIYGGGFSRQTIHRWFKKLVDKSDYPKESKKEIMTFLESVGKYSSTTKNKTNLLPESTKQD
ncbi:MAG: hypothetical protein PHP72_08830 [Dysgonamonadaceae bacterium]|nr:hypothetical protein [Dysgonamonadaceae bacterium]